MARGIFTSVTGLTRKIRKYISAQAKVARPFRWFYSDPTRRIIAISTTGQLSSHNNLIVRLALEIQAPIATSGVRKLKSVCHRCSRSSRAFLICRYRLGQPMLWMCSKLLGLQQLHKEGQDTFSVSPSLSHWPIELTLLARTSVACGQTKGGTR